MIMSALLGSAAAFEAGKTIIILNEIQDCPHARAALKFFQIDGRFDIIGTGSLFGMRGYGHELKSTPVGYETVIDMYPLDFEEFLRANGRPAQVIDELNRHLNDETSVPPAFHNLMRKEMLQYTVVVGMPDAVKTFVDTK